MPSPSDPTAFTLFGVGIRWYALFILAGIFAALWLSRFLARRRGLDPDFPIDVAPWVVLAGLVGARAYYLLLRWDYFLAHPDQALNLRLGGLTIHGALVGGIAMFAWLCPATASAPKTCSPSPSASMIASIVRPVAVTVPATVASFVTCARLMAMPTAIPTPLGRSAGSALGFPTASPEA